MFAKVLKSNPKGINQYSKGGASGDSSGTKLSPEAFISGRKEPHQMSMEELQTHAKTPRTGPGSGKWKSMIREEIKNRTAKKAASTLGFASDLGL